MLFPVRLNMAIASLSSWIMDDTDLHHVLVLSVILGEGVKLLDKVKGQNSAFPTLERKDPTTWADV